MPFSGSTHPGPMIEVPQLVSRATQLHRSGRLPEAESLYRQALQLDPGNYPVLHLFGLLRLQQNNVADAIRLMERALQVQPHSPETLTNYGMALKAAGRYQEALAVMDREAVLRPANARSLNNRGTILVKLKRISEAIQAFEAAAALERSNPEILTNFALALQSVRRLEEAVQLLSEVVRLRPRELEAWNNRGNCWREMNAPAAAFADFDQAHILAPGNPGIMLNRANALVAMGRLDEATSCFNSLLKTHPELVAARASRAIVSERKNRFNLAIADLEQVKSLNPDYPYAAGRLLYLKNSIADWKDLSQRKMEIDAAVRIGKRVVEPFIYNGLSESLADIQICARSFASDRYPTDLTPTETTSRREGPIRIGYLAGEFHHHATTLLSIGLFEHHDHERFEVFAFDNGQSDGSSIRARFEAAVPDIVSIADLSDQEAARRVRAAEIDILINLNGHAGLHRTGVFAQKPASIQVNYLGFPGTMGAPYMDYILADTQLIAEDEQKYFDEKIVWLPNSYQINDDRRPLPHPSNRSAHGLSEGAFVFAQFNANYKITPDLFAIWMRLLAQSENSVLWLLADNDQCADNLRNRAVFYGIDPARLVFAHKLPHSEHVGRLPLADLLLDTYPCSAHTIASEALWVGLPIVTCRGKTFAGRVAASLLEAAGLPELVAQDLPDYEKKAIALATKPELLKRLRHRLESNRLVCPLFDTGATTRHIEKAFNIMFGRLQAGLPPQSFRVPPSELLAAYPLMRSQIAKE